MQLSIIIVNYNVKFFLEQCLHSLQAATRSLQAEVLVVDNNSTDGSLSYLQPLFPWVKWIFNKQNTGFGVANNQAVVAANGQYILFLNPDTLLPEDCLEKCLAFMQAQPKAGALGIKMLDGSGQYLPESKRGFPSPLTSLFKLTGLSARFPKSRRLAKYTNTSPIKSVMAELTTGRNSPNNRDTT
ncbi:MAG: glycosyltransferase family 2 protein, partial [Hymenobacter sp.]